MLIPFGWKLAQLCKLQIVCDEVLHFNGQAGSPMVMSDSKLHHTQKSLLEYYNITFNSYSDVKYLSKTLSLTKFPNNVYWPEVKTHQLVEWNLLDSQNYEAHVAIESPWRS